VGIFTTNMKRIVAILTSVIFLLLFILGYFCWYFAGETVAPVPIDWSANAAFANSKFRNVEEMLFNLEVRVFRVKFETLRIPERPAENEKITLRGWLIPAPQRKTAPTIIALHSYKSDKAGSVWSGSIFARAGYNVLMYDQRHHGISQGDYTTFGYRESYDLQAAIDYLEHRKDINTKNLVVIGHSMGGAAAILAASRDSRIKAIIADSCPSDFPKSFLSLNELTAGPLFSSVFSGLIRSLAEMRAGFSFDKVVPVEDIKSVEIPSLFIRCLTDPVVPPHCSADLLAASPAKIKQMHTFSKCNHCAAQFAYPEEYEKTVLDFLSKVH
jgi:uncharacterized protein